MWVYVGGILTELFFHPKSKKAMRNRAVMIICHWHLFSYSSFPSSTQPEPRCGHHRRYKPSAHEYVSLERVSSAAKEAVTG